MLPLKSGHDYWSKFTNLRIGNIEPDEYSTLKQPIFTPSEH